jgi:hypothetical protein
MFNKDGISGDELRARFWIGRAGESATLPTQSNDPPGNPPITIAGRMMQIIGEYIVLAVKAVYWIFVPPAGPAGLVAEASMRATQMATEIAESKALELAMDASKAVRLDQLDKVATAAKAATGLAAMAPSLAKISTAVPAVATGLAPSLVKISTAASASTQHGGAREEPLSTEAQIMGATVIALIAGGSLKGLVDYLMKE